MGLTEERRKVLFDRTAAKVLWGEREDLIIEFLREEGLGGEEIVDLLNEAKSEQKKVVRKRGIRKLIFSVVMLIVFSIFPVFYYLKPELLVTIRAKMIVVLSIFAWTFCFILVIRAIREMVSGESEEGATLKE